MLENAIRLAAKIHKGQKDRAQKPYILHVMRVMMRGQDLEEQLLGALHDVLERSKLTTAELAEKGFPARVLTSLEHISRVEGEEGHLEGRKHADIFGISETQRIAGLGLFMHQFDVLAVL